MSNYLSEGEDSLNQSQEKNSPSKKNTLKEEFFNEKSIIIRTGSFTGTW
jgi:hypothetical protein